jgi:actin-like ATPase involved in cell morphogenesis
MSADTAHDLGITNTLVRVRGRSIGLAAPSVVAIPDISGENQAVAVGEQAHAMLGRRQSYIARSGLRGKVMDIGMAAILDPIDPGPCREVLGRALAR